MSLDFGTGGSGPHTPEQPEHHGDPAAAPVGRAERATPRWVPAAIAIAVFAGVGVGLGIGALAFGGNSDAVEAAPVTSRPNTESVAPATAPTTSRPGTSTTGTAPDDTGALAFGPIEVDGSPLVRYQDGVTDQSIGAPVPSIAGVDLDGSSLVIATDDGRAKLVMFVAHWCPHCQDELPAVRDWLSGTTLPDTVDFVAVTTLTDPTRPNFPPGPWFEAEGWEWPVLVDDEQSSAAGAVGLHAVPFWVLIDADGTLAGRGAGALTPETLDQIVERLAEGPDAG